MRFDKFEVKIGRFLGFFVKSVKNKLTGSGRYSVETSSLGSFDPCKKVRIELPASAVLWTLSRTSTYGSCSQVSLRGHATEKLYR